MLEPGMRVVADRIGRQRHRAVVVDLHPFRTERAQVQPDRGRARPAVEGEADRAPARLGALELVGNGEDGGLGLAARVGEDRAGDRHELERGRIGHRLAAEPHLPFALDRRPGQELFDQLAAPLLGVLGRRRRAGGGGGWGRSGRGVDHQPYSAEAGSRLAPRLRLPSLQRANRHEAPRRQRHHRPCRQRLPDRRHAAPGERPGAVALERELRLRSLGADDRVRRRLRQPLPADDGAAGRHAAPGRGDGGDRERARRRASGALHAGGAPARPRPAVPAAEPLLPVGHAGARAPARSSAAPRRATPRSRRSAPGSRPISSTATARATSRPTPPETLAAAPASAATSPTSASL